jgi:hypothetical protein
MIVKRSLRIRKLTGRTEDFSNAPGRIRTVRASARVRSLQKDHEVGPPTFSCCCDCRDMGQPFCYKEAYSFRIKINLLERARRQIELEEKKCLDS